MDIIQEEYYDGIAFYTVADDGGIDKEIAFYSKITDRMTYNQNWDKNTYNIGCSSIPMDMNCKIIDEVIKYKLRLGG